jgi:sugar lactone lactonase YvrE
MGESPFWSERYNAFFWTDWYDTNIRKMDYDTREITKIPLLDSGSGVPVVKSFGESVDGTFIAAFANQGIGSIEIVSQDG